MSWKAKEGNLIYEDEDIKIYRNGAEDGTVGFADCFRIVGIGFDGLKEWKNQGLMYKEDLAEIFQGFRDKMDAMLNSFDGYNNEHDMELVMDAKEEADERNEGKD